MSMLRTNENSDNLTVSESLDSLLESISEGLVDCELLYVKTIEDAYISSYYVDKYKTDDTVKEGFSLINFNIKMLCRQYTTLLDKLHKKFESVSKPIRKEYNSTINSFNEENISEKVLGKHIYISSFNFNRDIPSFVYVDKLIHIAMSNFGNEDFIDSLYAKRMHINKPVYSNTKITNNIYTGKDKPTNAELEQSRNGRPVDKVELTKNVILLCTKQNRFYDDEALFIKKTIAHTKKVINNIDICFNNITDTGNFFDMVIPGTYGKYNTIYIDFINACTHIIKTLYNIIITKIQNYIQSIKQNIAIINYSSGKDLDYNEDEVISNDDSIELYRSV